MPPYPADTRAKGWRFEIDTEAIKESDTWLKAKTGALKGALLLLWMQSWQQKPCGTLPDDDELIALLLDMPAAEFAANRAVLMRGWWKAEDGRLYHKIITARVLAMLDKRASDAQRAANRRARTADSMPTPPERPARVTRDNPVSSTPSTKHQNQAPDSEPGGTVAGTPSGDAPQPAKKRARKPKRPAGEPAPTAATWAAYSSEYEKRYGAKPVSNAKNNGMLAQFLARIPAEEAPQVARHFVRSSGNLYVNSGHALNLLIRDAEKLRTEWVTGRVVSNVGTALTRDKAAQADRLMGSYALQMRAADAKPRLEDFIDMEEPHARLADD